MNNRLLNISILSISMITVMASAAISPALANIAAAFPDASINTIKTVLTLPSLFIIPFSLISGMLVARYGNKKVLYTGIIIYIIGGVGPVMANTLGQLLFYRAVLGCGCGLIVPVSQSLIALNYTGETRARMTGYSAAASYLMGVIASFTVAPVSGINWHYGFFIYLIAVVVLVLNIIALPSDAPLQNTAKHKAKISKPVWFLIAGMFLLNVAFYAVPANVALFMRERGIGGAGSAGYVISAFMLAGLAGGLSLVFIRKVFQKYTATFGTGVMAAGYAVLSFSSNLTMVSCGAAMVGFSFAVLFPLILSKINNKCGKTTVVFALSLAGCAQFLGQFTSPYILHLLKSVYGKYYLHYDFIILFFVLSAAFILLFISKRSKRFYKALYPADPVVMQDV
ncbi:MFS family permease [Elusimicrobium simillimum]|uniref:MFS transporter n=1 Tax=Elusimicrobium simillimum TaxID=3143438 RepID=UPI003C6F2285